MASRDSACNKFSNSHFIIKRKVNFIVQSLLKVNRKYFLPRLLLFFAFFRHKCWSYNQNHANNENPHEYFCVFPCNASAEEEDILQSIDHKARVVMAAACSVVNVIFWAVNESINCVRIILFILSTMPPNACVVTFETVAFIPWLINIPNSGFVGAGVRKEFCLALKSSGYRVRYSIWISTFTNLIHKNRHLIWWGEPYHK